MSIDLVIDGSELVKQSIDDFLERTKRSVRLREHFGSIKEGTDKIKDEILYWVEELKGSSYGALIEVYDAEGNLVAYGAAADGYNRFAHSAIDALKEAMPRVVRNVIRGNSLKPKLSKLEPAYGEHVVLTDEIHDFMTTNPISMYKGVRLIFPLTMGSTEVYYSDFSDEDVLEIDGIRIKRLSDGFLSGYAVAGFHSFNPLRGTLSSYDAVEDVLGDIIRGLNAVEISRALGDHPLSEEIRRAIGFDMAGKITLPTGYRFDTQLSVSELVVSGSDPKVRMHQYGLKNIADVPTVQRIANPIDFYVHAVPVIGKPLTPRKDNFHLN